MAPGRRGRRRQDRRRRRHPPADPPGLLQAARPAHRPRGPSPAPRRGHGLPAQDRPRRPGALPLHRRDRDPALRLHHLRVAPGAGGRRRHRREGQRQPSRDRADHDRQHQGGEQRPVRDRPLHHPPAHRERGAGRVHQGLLHLLAVVACGDLQGHVPGRAADGVLSGPAGRPLHFQLRRLSPALFHQHLSHLAPRPALPRPRPQRRDQHAQRQYQLDGLP